MKEYKCIEIGYTGDETEELLNLYAKNGWRLVCSYASGNKWLILERDKKICPKCKK